jgi:hypothetical protein
VQLLSRATSRDAVAVPAFVYIAKRYSYGGRNPELPTQTFGALTSSADRNRCNRRLAVGKEREQLLLPRRIPIAETRCEHLGVSRV